MDSEPAKIHAIVTKFDEISNSVLCGSLFPKATFFCFLLTYLTLDLLVLIAFSIRINVFHPGVIGSSEKDQLFANARADLDLRCPHMPEGTAQIIQGPSG